MMGFDPQYFLAYHSFEEGDLEHIAKLLRSGEELSSGTRRLIADILIKKRKRKPGVKKDGIENFHIFTAMADLMQIHGYKLWEAGEELEENYQDYGLSKKTSKAYQDVYCMTVSEMGEDWKDTWKRSHEFEKLFEKATEPSLLDIAAKSARDSELLYESLKQDLHSN